MDQQTSFDAERYYELLLEGSRRAFQRLQSRYAHEHIYYFTLCLSAGYDVVEPGIKTEEELRRWANRMLSAALERGKTATLEDFLKLLRYDTPDQDYRAGAESNEPLKAANVLLADFGEQYIECFEENNIVVRTDDEGDEIAETPLDDVEAQVIEMTGKVLRTLDREGLFGTGEARESVVIDIGWFEGAMPNAFLYATGQIKDPPPPMNPPSVEGRYHRTLAEGWELGQKLSGT